MGQLSNFEQSSHYNFCLTENVSIQYLSLNDLQVIKNKCSLTREMVNERLAISTTNKLNNPSTYLSLYKITKPTEKTRAQTDCRPSCHSAVLARWILASQKCFEKKKKMDFAKFYKFVLIPESSLKSFSYQFSYIFKTKAFTTKIGSLRILSW